MPAPGPTKAHEQSDQEPEPTDGLVATCTARDDLRSWMTAGQTTSAVWLQAMLSGLAVAAVNQVIEVELTRRLLQRDLFSNTGRPQICFAPVGLTSHGHLMPTRPAAPGGRSTRLMARRRV